MKGLKGGCYCGAIRYEITKAPEWSGHCHCRSCQLALGGAFVTWAKVPAEGFAITKGSLYKGRSLEIYGTSRCRFSR